MIASAYAFAQQQGPALCTLDPLHDTTAAYDYETDGQITTTRYGFLLTALTRSARGM